MNNKITLDQAAKSYRERVEERIDNGAIEIMLKASGLSDHQKRLLRTELVWLAMYSWHAGLIVGMEHITLKYLANTQTYKLKPTSTP